MTATSPDGELDLAGVLGHELRNPLAAVLTGISVVCEMTDRDDPRTEFLQRAMRDLGRVSAILSGCLQLGSAALRNASDVDVTDSVLGIAHRHDNVRVTGQPAGAIVRGDAALLERVIENLVENARAAQADTVTISVECVDRRVAIDVIDDGPGVPAELAGRLFEPFVSGGAGGSGLGLAVAARILAAHDGSIALLESPRGAHFRITLPAR